MGFVQTCLLYGQRSVIFATRLLSRPCQGVLAQRAERSMKLWCLYSKLYDRHSARRVLTRLGSSIQNKVSPKSRRLLLLLSASAPLIRLDKSSVIKENDIEDFLVQAIQSMRGEKFSDSPLIRDHITGDSSKLVMSSQSKVAEPHKSMNWEMFLDGDSVTVWRRHLPDRPTHLYEYLVYGSYNDIQPVAFHVAQSDVNYRRQWDSYTIDLQLLRSDTQSQSKMDFIRWIVSFPFPLAPREYVLCRQSKVDMDKNMIVAISKAIPPDQDPQSDSAKKPPQKGSVRVMEYYSIMVVVPHTSLDEPGMDFVLLYFDDPQMPSGKFSKCAQSVGAGTGMRDYLSRLRKAALCLQSNPNPPRLLPPPPPPQDPRASPASSRQAVESFMAELGALSA